MIKQKSLLSKYILAISFLMMFNFTVNACYSERYGWIGYPIEETTQSSFSNWLTKTFYSQSERCKHNLEFDLSQYQTQVCNTHQECCYLSYSAATKLKNEFYDSCMEIGKLTPEYKECMSRSNAAHLEHLKKCMELDPTKIAITAASIIGVSILIYYIYKYAKRQKIAKRIFKNVKNLFNNVKNRYYQTKSRRW